MTHESRIPILLSLILVAGKLTVLPPEVPWAVVGLPVLAYYAGDILVWLFSALIATLYLSVLTLFILGCGFVFCCAGAWFMVSEGINKLRRA